MNMRLIGARNMAELVPSMVDTSALNSGGGPMTMYDENCECTLLSFESDQNLADERIMPVGGVRAKL